MAGGVLAGSKPLRKVREFRHQDTESINGPIWLEGETELSSLV